MNPEQISEESDLAKNIERGIKDMSAFYKSGSVTQEQVEVQLGFMKDHFAELKKQNDPSFDRLLSLLKTEFPDLTKEF